MEGSGDLAIALQLVRRGFVCIAPDMIGFGERIPPSAQPYHDSIAFYNRHPGWSFMGKMIWDVSRVVDYLETLPDVDPLQIGCIGHSHGAYTTIFATAFEPRISLAVASCGFNTFRADPTPNRWSHLTPLMPQIGTYLPDAASIPFDWQQLCAMIAPRPLFVWYATQDTCFPNTTGLLELFRDVRNVYGLYGAADDLAWHGDDGPHGFPKRGRDSAYQWIEQRLFAVGDIHRIPQDRAAWDKQRELIRRVVRRSIGTPVGDPPPFDMKVLATDTLPTYERRLIEYAVDKGERIKAYLCVPTYSEPRAQAGDQPPNARLRSRLGMSRGLPAVLVLHQTAKVGKREAVGLEGIAGLAFGAELAERGYITLSPDSICAGERIDTFGPFDTRGHYLRHPELSAMGRMLYDAQRALDLLVQTDGVDPHRLACIGHSLGAEESVMLAAFDERIRAAISSCGFAMIEAEEKRLRWARDEWFSYMPKLRPVLQRGQLPLWDWGDVIRLAAPRGYFQFTAEDDKTFPASMSSDRAAVASGPIWRLYGRPEGLIAEHLPGPHQFPQESRFHAYAWLDRMVGQSEKR